MLLELNERNELHEPPMQEEDGSGCRVKAAKAEGVGMPSSGGMLA